MLTKLVYMFSQKKKKTTTTLGQFSTNKLIKN